MAPFGQSHSSRWHIKDTERPQKNLGQGVFQLEVRGKQKVETFMEVPWEIILGCLLRLTGSRGTENMLKVVSGRLAKEHSK